MISFNRSQAVGGVYSIVMSMYIGKIGKDDVDVILNLNNIIFNDLVKYTRSYITKVCDMKTGYIVYLDSVPAGYIFCDKCYNEIPNKWVTTVMSIGVLEESRKLGFGRALLKCALELYPDEDVYLCVKESNKKAQTLYTSEGFIVVGTITKYYKDEDAIVMAKIYKIDK
jgi:ribosomal protein S18 acetylase RimI-like enzyme